MFLRVCWKVELKSGVEAPTALPYSPDLFGERKGIIHEETGSFTVDHKVWIPHFLPSLFKRIVGYRKNASVARGQALVV